MVAMTFPPGPKKLDDLKALSTANDARLIAIEKMWREYGDFVHASFLNINGYF